MHGHASNYKGKKQSPTYNSWRSMIQRCRNEKHAHYDRYNSLGYDPAWGSFENFLRDMGVRPQNCTLDRVDNEKGYCKSNCKWSSIKQQQRNRRSVVMTKELADKVRHMRKNKMTVTDISRDCGISVSLVSNVLYKGNWS